MQRVCQDVQKQLPSPALVVIIGGGIYMPSDGSANPIDLTNSVARSARSHGATMLENTGVEQLPRARGIADIGIGGKYQFSLERDPAFALTAGMTRQPGPAGHLRNPA